MKSVLISSLASLWDVNHLMVRPNEGQCLVIFWRHFPHKDNRTIRRWLRLAFKIGQKFKSHLKIAAAYASPEPRCQQHLMALMEGMNQMVQLRTDDRLGALNNESPILLKLMEDRAVDTHTSLETLILDDADLEMLRSKRGQEGASCLLDIATRNCGQIVVVGSHGASRLEPTIAALANRKQMDYPHLMGRGGMAILLLDCHTGDLVEENYIEFDHRLVEGYGY